MRPTKAPETLKVFGAFPFARIFDCPAWGRRLGTAGARMAQCRSTAAEYTCQLGRPPPLEAADGTTARPSRGLVFRLPPSKRPRVSFLRRSTRPKAAIKFFRRSAMSSIPRLYTPRLCLRAFTPADAPRVQELAGNPLVAHRTLNVPHPYPDAGRGKMDHDPRVQRESGEIVGIGGDVAGNTHTRARARCHGYRTHGRHDERHAAEGW